MYSYIAMYAENLIFLHNMSHCWLILRREVLEVFVDFET